MEQGEPNLVPEWYKGASGSANSNPHTGSLSHLDDHNSGISSRNRMSVSACDHGAPRSSAKADSSSLSSFRRSASSNGSMGHDKDTSSHSRPYSSFGRSHRDRDMDRDRDRENDLLLLDNGFCDFSDPFTTSWTEKDTLRRSRSMISGRWVDSWSKRPGSDLSNGVLSCGTIASGISKASFERDFPSLGAEEKLEVSDVGRVSSPVLSNAIQSLPLGASAIIGGDGWTSALAEVPAIVGGNGPVLSSALPSVANLASTASTSTMGLNMAETLAQGPPCVRTTPQISIDTQRIEELNRIHYSKLIPVTPSAPKTSVLNSSEKTKSKGARSSDFSAPKVGQQLANHTVHSSASRSDAPKTSQAGNFQVLNREKNSISSAAKDGPKLMNASRVAAPLGGFPSAAVVPPQRNPVNPRLKADGKGGGEKKPLSLAQDRNDFFNSLRKKTSANNSSAINLDPSSSSPSDSGGKSGEHQIVTGTCAAAAGCLEKDVIPVVLSSGLKCLLENRNGDACEEPERLTPDEEEAAFLRSLGWEENAGEEVLTAEEIESFVKEYEKLRPSSKLKVVLLEWQRSSSSESELEA